MHSDKSEESIIVPIFVGTELVSQYNWGITTTSQIYLDGTTRWLPQGKALGGGTILNAYLWNRGNTGDYDAWVSLGNPGWGWTDLLPYFIKVFTSYPSLLDWPRANNRAQSETYTPVESQDISETYGITDTPGIHGYNGPVSVTYQRYFYNVSCKIIDPLGVRLKSLSLRLIVITIVQWYKALESLDIPVVEPNDGLHAGAMFLPLDLNATNMTRADARRSYYDPFVSRSNLYVSTGRQVTGLIFSNLTCNSSSSKDTLRTIAGVTFAAAAGGVVSSVYAKREVVLAAGSLHTPQILELSGIGTKSVLDRFDIDQKIDLPGVGNNLQDHFQSGLWSYLYNSSYVYPTDFNNNATLMAMAKDEYYANRTGPWTAGPPNGIAFPSLAQISDKKDDIAATASAQSRGQYLADGLDPTVIAGYEAMKPLLESALRDTQRSVIEILNNNAGGMAMSNMRPFCRGHSHIRSTDPFDMPAVDPRWGSNPIDIDVLVESVYFNRKIFATPAMSVFGAWQAGPTVEADDKEIRSYLASNGGTEFHPSGTCAMLPKSIGGVVDPELLVYGTSNLRIVDASIYPILPAAHLQAVVYAVAEKAADIIKSQNMPVSYPHPPGDCPAPINSAISISSTVASIPTTLPTIPSSALANHTRSVNASRTVAPYPSRGFTTSYLLSLNRTGTSTTCTLPSLHIPVGHLPPWLSGLNSRPSGTATSTTKLMPSPIGGPVCGCDTWNASSIRACHNHQLSQSSSVFSGMPVPPMHPRPILFPGSYPDTHPFDHPWEPEPVWNPKAIDRLIPISVFGPAPSPGSGVPAAWPVYGLDLTMPLPSYAVTTSQISSPPTASAVLGFISR